MLEAIATRLEAISTRLELEAITMSLCVNTVFLGTIAERFSCTGMLKALMSLPARFRIFCHPQFLPKQNPKKKRSLSAFHSKLLNYVESIGIDALER